MPKIVHSFVESKKYADLNSEFGQVSTWVRSRGNRVQGEGEQASLSIPELRYVHSYSDFPVHWRWTRSLSGHRGKET